MNPAIYKRLRSVPNSKHIKEIYHDDDGWWVILKSGYVNTAMDNAQTVNGENWNQLREAMKEVSKAVG